MAERTQQQLRSTQASLRAGGRAQQIQRKEIQVQQKRQQQAIQKVATQTSTIDKRLQELESQKGSPQSEIAAGQTLTGKRDYERALAEMKKINFEVEQLKKLKGGLGDGSYYRDFESVLKDISKTGSEIEKAHTQRWERAASARESKTQIPKGAKIIRTEYKDGERIVTYELPGQQRAPITSQVVTDSGVQKIPTGFATQEILDVYSKFQEQIPESERRKLTQYEISQRITSDPSYQKEVGKIVAQPETQREIKEVVKGVKFTPEFETKILSASSFIASTPREQIDITREKPREIYSPLLGGFVQATVAGGEVFGQATAQVRPPTDIERKRIERFTKRDNILFTSTTELKRRVEETKSLQSRLEDLSKANIKDEKWVGSEKDLREYNRLIGKLETIDQTVTTGIGKGKFAREVPITEFDIERRPIGTTFQIFGSVAGSVLGGVGETLGEAQEEIERVTPKRVFQPFSFRATKPEIGRKAGELIGEVGVGLGKYLTPAGGLIFAAEVTEFGVGLGKTIKTKEEITKEQKIEAAVLGGVILTAGVIKGVQYLRAPITKVVKTGKRKVTIDVTTRFDELAGKRIRIDKEKVKVLPSERFLKRVETEVVREKQRYGIEIAQPVIKGEKQILRTYPVVIEEPAIIKETTIFSKAGRKRFDVKKDRIEIKFGKPKIIEPFAQKPIVSGEPFVLREARVLKTGKLGEPKFTFIDAEGKFIPVEDISRLPKVQRFTLLKTIEKEKLAKKPIKEEDILKFLKEEERVQVGISRELDIAKPVGKQTSLYAQVAIVEERAPIGDIRVLDIKAGAKEITKPFPRARGRVETIKIKYLELPAKDITPTEVTTIVGTGIKKTPLSKTFALQDVQALKFPKPKPTKVPKPKIESIILEAPKIEPKPTSIYTGTGLYERTEGVEALAPIQRDGQILSVKLDVPVRVDEREKIDTVQIIREKQKLKEKQISIVDTKLKERLEYFQPSEIQVKQREAIKVKPKEKLTSRQILNQLLEMKQIQRPRIPEKIRPKELIKPKVPKRIRLFGEAEVKREPAKKALKDFKVFVTKFGKETEIGEFITLPEARKKLKKELVETIRAGGFIERAGKKLTFEEVGLFGEEFRPSKVSPFKVIQKKEKRLRRVGEVKEIQYFRKQGGGSFL